MPLRVLHTKFYFAQLRQSSPALYFLYLRQFHQEIMERLEETKQALIKLPSKTQLVNFAFVFGELPSLAC